MQRKDLAISFVNIKDILTFIAELNTRFNLKDIANHRSLYLQFIIAKNGRTYLLEDILRLNQKDIIELKLEFLTFEDNYVDVATIQRNPGLKLTYNRCLSNLLLDFLAKPKSALLHVDLPNCGIQKMPLMFPMITSYGYTYETYAIEQLLREKKNDPIARSALTENDVVKDLSLQDFIWVINIFRQQYLIKLKAIVVNPADLEKKEVIESLIQNYSDQNVYLQNHLQVQIDTLKTTFAEYSVNKAELLKISRPDLYSQLVPQLSTRLWQTEQIYFLEKSALSELFHPLYLIAALVVMLITECILGFIFVTLKLLCGVDKVFNFLPPISSNPIDDEIIKLLLVTLLAPLALVFAIWSFYVAKGYYSTAKIARELELLPLIIKDKQLTEVERTQLVNLPNRITELKNHLEKISPLRAHSILTAGSQKSQLQLLPLRLSIGW